MVKTYAVNCNDAWLNTKGDDISGSYVKYEDYAALEAERDALLAGLINKKDVILAGMMEYAKIYDELGARASSYDKACDYYRKRDAVTAAAVEIREMLEPKK